MDNDEKLKLEPVRRLEDFIFGARFQIPDYKDKKRLIHRITQNLLYYQTNYILLFNIITICIGLIKPSQVILGAAAVLAIIWLSQYLERIRRGSELIGRNGRKIPKFASLTILILGGYLIVYLLTSAVVFVLGALVAILTCLFHASARLRNLKNKIDNFDKERLRNTPIGMFLEGLGYSFESDSEKDN